MFFYNFEKEIEKWINIIISENNIPKNIVAINFWIFEGENWYCIYLIWSREYDIDNDDWAWNEDYIPESKYFEVKYKKINKLDWEEFLKLTINNLNNILLKQEIQNSIIWKIKHITIWFDDGDLVIIK